jgi:hypothetical protein
MQMRPALYVALIALSPLTLLIDRIIPAERFAWNKGAYARRSLSSGRSKAGPGGERSPAQQGVSQ